MEYAFLSGLGLAAPSGLNAYIPLLILALADRLTTKVDLANPYSFISSIPGIMIILALLTIELVVDKIPGADHVNDLIQSAIRPAAGAIVMMAITSTTSDINPVISLLFGLTVAGGVHAAKATARPAVTVSTGGIGNPFISMVEDLFAVVASIVALVAPLLVVVVLLLMAFVLVWSYRRIKRLKIGSRYRGTGTPPTPPVMPQS